MSETPEVRDRAGIPVTAEHGGTFVRISRPNHLAPGRLYERQGLVSAVTFDRAGTLLEVREWRAGRFSGRKLLARPDHVEVTRAPDKLREAQAEEARIATRKRLREEDEAHRKRMEKLRRDRDPAR